MKKSRLPALYAATVAILLLAPIGTTTAEEVRVPVQDQAQRSLEEDLPRNGLSEAAVRNRWGAPQSVTGPIGEPPIHQWHYQDFIVFFEGNRVIHSVFTRNR